MDPSPGLLSRRAVDVLKWTEDCVERVGEGGITLASSSSTDRLRGLRTPGLSSVGSLGFLEWAAEVVGGAGLIDSSWLATWMAGVELRSSVTMDGISGLLPLSILQWVKSRERWKQLPGLRAREREGGGGRWRGLDERHHDVLWCYLDPSVGNKHSLANYRRDLARVRSEFGGDLPVRSRCTREEGVGGEGGFF